MKRRIIHIDEEKCNGCGACAAACHEGAIAMVDGKARLIRDDYCDGLGDCLPADSAKIVSQHIEVEDGWTTAFQTLKGPALDAVALPDSSKLPQILSQLRERNLGKACFQLPEAAFEAPESPVPPNAKMAADAVRSQSEEIAAYARNAVAGCYFC